ncbi:MAG: hypothetical protein J5585_07540 [Clostridia bacterium]|nr:hypothetical protein [Clostridia bacterium]
MDEQSVVLYEAIFDYTENDMYLAVTGRGAGYKVFFALTRIVFIVSFCMLTSVVVTELVMKSQPETVISCLKAAVFHLLICMLSFAAGPTMYSKIRYRIMCGKKKKPEIIVSFDGQAVSVCVDGMEKEKTPYKDLWGFRRTRAGYAVTSDRSLFTIPDGSFVKGDAEGLARFMKYRTDIRREKALSAAVTVASFFLAALLLAEVVIMVILVMMIINL